MAGTHTGEPLFRNRKEFLTALEDILKTGNIDDLLALMHSPKVCLSQGATMNAALSPAYTSH